MALPEGSEDFIVYCDASIKGPLGRCVDFKGKRHYLYGTKSTRPLRIEKLEPRNGPGSLCLKWPGVGYLELW
ncbi:hypothetical protein Tco_0938212 [Tanacetum coccineum]|uniref:Uncharacterized protein n=1 Tax=Tanacetum coccineum TaxID=301880 RepID=A0ABQ5DHE7_9ASTR